MEEGSLLERRTTGGPRQVFDPRGGIVIDETPPRGAVQALFDEVYVDDKDRSDANFTRFHTYLLQQVTNIRQKTGCMGVKFRVESTGGKTKLKAKPV